MEGGGPGRTNGDPAVHRALASQSRRRILRLLRSGGALQLEAIARQSGLHPSTVREHLKVLLDANLIRQSPGTPSGPGRPAHRYEIIPSSKPEQDGYRLLAAVLADHLRASTDDARAAGEAAGLTWGGALFETLAADASEREARELVLHLFDDLGFEPSLEQGEQPGESRIRLHRCPFLELARTNTDVVCGVHLGLLRGALDAMDAPLEATRLEPFVEPDLCVAHLTVR